MSVVDNKKIAKNTVMLYIRMLLLMAVSLYTSRVVLQVLGIEDYGIYNLVGGFISIFSIVQSAMVSAVQRFFNVTIGQGDDEQYTRIYSMSINIFAIISAFLLIVGGLIGSWFVYNFLNLPEGREITAVWVFILSVITSIVNLFRAPDNASIIAFEKMDFYAFISILEAILKLLIVFLLMQFNSDKLILYCLLYLFTTLVINIAYKIFVNKNFSLCRYRLLWDREIFKKLFVFSGWNLLTQSAHIVETQGESFLTNRYYGVSLNAAKGISAQVYNAVNLFLINFQVSFKPQLIKSYAAGEYESHYQLIYRASKFSFLLLSIIVFPLIFNLESLLPLWLVEVPPFTKEFCIYILLAYLFDSVSAPLSMSIFAQGNIKSISIWSAVLYFLGLLLSYAGFKIFDLPYITAIICMMVHALILICYMHYAQNLCGVSILNFTKKVLIPIIVVMPFFIASTWGISQFMDNVWLEVPLCVVVAVFVAFTIGMTKSERRYILSKLPILKKYI